jgi:Protein of unknown function (DUF2934)
MARENKTSKSSIVAARENEEPLPTPPEIARRAYEIFLEHGSLHGRDLDDWLQAEHELKEEGRCDRRSF